ncbi:hypothetical protein [Acholeplasma hippikon]|nr:hypothetical protein [Acholeplasma hippikon]
MADKKLFKEIEKRLDYKIEKINKNEIVLKEDVFKDGRLTKLGYVNLKAQAEYISTNDEIDLFIPFAYEAKFMNTLEYLAALEIARIKSDLRQARWIAIILFLIGLVLLIIPTIIPLLQQKVFNDIEVIISWVFIWSSVEKMFFERNSLKKDKMKILHILSANIITY